MVRDIGRRQLDSRVITSKIQGYEEIFCFLIGDGSFAGFLL
jgi:hypothetical protein